MNDPIKVVIIDDHGMLREGLKKQFFEPNGMKVVGDFGEGISAREAIPALQPDLVTTGIHQPGEDGIQTIRKLREAGCKAKIIVLTASDNPPQVHEAMNAGADAYVLKQTASASLLAVIRQVFEGEKCVLRSQETESWWPPTTARPGPRVVYTKDEVWMGSEDRWKGARMTKKEAERGARALCRILGNAWTARVWHQTGWHYTAQNDRLQVHPWMGKFFCSLSEQPGGSGTPSVWHDPECYLDPRDAVRGQVLKIHRYLEHVQEVATAARIVMERMNGAKI